MTIACLSTNGTNHFNLAAPVKTLYIATISGVETIERRDDGTWKKVAHTLEGSHISAMTLAAATGKVFAAAMPGTVMASSDGARTWHASGQGITEKGAYSLRCYEGSNGASVLYAGAQPVALYRSADGGASWTDLASVRTAPLHETWRFPAPGHEPHLKTLAVDPRHPEVIYAGVEQGALLKSIDGGASWRDLDQFVDYENFVYKDIHQIVLRPSNADEVYITTGLGIYHSTDNGETWSQLTSSDFRIGYPDQLLFAPDDDRKLFVSGGFAIPYYWVEAKTAKGTVMVSDDGGKNWRPPRGGFPESRANVEAMSMCAYPGGYEIFAGTTDGEVFVSADGGETWSPIVREMAAISKPTHDTLINGLAYANDLKP